MSTKNINVIDREGQEHAVEWSADQSLMEVLRDNDFPILASCGGTASCATCHVFLEKEAFPSAGERSEDELELLVETDTYVEDRSRLSCQLGFESSCEGATVTIAPE
ncbi:(2Fe-2S)-binding protein [Arthrobacter sp. AK01]|uniref:2Fe-2S iron-sulfur cluster-binding protein n=1 Tax=Micrococcaceae TaxID=1268 RepID=UPI001E3CC10B|nr:MULTISPECIES: 2Fe-2S iron-sulfur cluster-binding protein [Micrococcaceae]MCD4852679.1 (2Fe-2S)-binding protein [Arthrobacter sp. AK01]MCP1411149.1 2Fe-2S ferredoxin [Paenarthrobacter sp. A20]